MRSRLTILCGVILLSFLSPRPASASGWSAFVAWLSDLDPQSGGFGVDVPVRPFCKPGDRPSTCTESKDKRWPIFGASTALLVASVEGQPGKIYVWPALGVAEWNVSKTLELGGGVGFIRVTNWLVQARATVALGAGFSFRVEGNLIPRGYPADAFGPGKPATGTEFVPGLAFVWKP
jgi:hypothetical protein